MKKTIKLLMVPCVLFLLLSCSDRENNANNVLEREKLQTVNPKANLSEKDRFSSIIVQNTQPLLSNKTLSSPSSKMEDVQEKTDELAKLMNTKVNKRNENNNKLNELLKTDWHTINDPLERYLWAIKIGKFDEGQDLQVAALMSLTNTKNTVVAIRVYHSLAKHFGEQGNLLEVKKILEVAEKYFGIDPEKRENIKESMPQINKRGLSMVYELRSFLSYQINNQKFAGQYDNNIDNKSEIYWNKLVVKCNGKNIDEKTSANYATLAYSLIRDGKRNEAKKNLDIAINTLSQMKTKYIYTGDNTSRINKLKIIKEKLESKINGLKSIKEEWEKGGNSTVGTFYW